MEDREILEVDVLFVGGGPANLSGAVHLSNLIQDHNEKVEKGLIQEKPLGEISIALLEKGKEIGSHIISGCIFDPRTLKKLFPDCEQGETPLKQKVEKDSVYFLTEKGHIPLPFVPKPLDNRGHYMISLGKLARWMGEKLEEKGVDILCEFPGAELLYDGNRVIGVRTGDKGLDKNGNPKNNYEPGADILAPVTILGEGSRGSLTKTYLEKFREKRPFNPQVYAVGVKEIWKIPSSKNFKGKAVHTFGYPLDKSTYGGGFLYGMEENLLAVGYVVGLDYENPLLDPHLEFQRFKTHPFVSEILSGGEIISYGAKTLPEGGYYSIPEIYGDGIIITGDSAGFLDSFSLKGVHLAVESGIQAAETIFEALKAKDFSEKTLKGYQKRIRESLIEKELYRVRNFHQGFQKGLVPGLLNGMFQNLTQGKWGKPMKTEEGHKRMKRLGEFFGGHLEKYQPGKIKFDNKLTFDKETDVYYSGTNHNEDQPCHLRLSDPEICRECIIEFGSPCQHFCPANVYEIVEKENSEEKELKINPANCVHCKTCDIMDPYEIIDWTPPEGGGGPLYQNQ